MGFTTWTTNVLYPNFLLHLMNKWPNTCLICNIVFKVFFHYNILLWGPLWGLWTKPAKPFEKHCLNLCILMKMVPCLYIMGCTPKIKL